MLFHPMLKECEHGSDATGAFFHKDGADFNGFGTGEEHLYYGITIVDASVADKF